MTKTIDLDIPKDSAERIRLENESTARVRERITEVLRKYGVSLSEAPLDALALAMKRMVDAKKG